MTFFLCKGHTWIIIIKYGLFWMVTNDYMFLRFWHLRQCYSIFYFLQGRSLAIALDVARRYVQLGSPFCSFLFNILPCFNLQNISLYSHHKPKVPRTGSKQYKNIKIFILTVCLSSTSLNNSANLTGILFWHNYLYALVFLTKNSPDHVSSDNQSLYI